MTEAGASNFFVVWKTKEGTLQLVTAPLDTKIILDGVTRRSVLELARERLGYGSKFLTTDLEGLEVVERAYTMIELEEAWKEGRLVEAFVSGTAVSFLFASIAWMVISDATFSTLLHRSRLLISVRRNWISKWEMEQVAFMLLY